MNSPFQAATDGCYQGSPLRGRGRGIYRPSGSLPLNPLLDLGLCYQGSPLRGRGRGIYRPSGSLSLNPFLDLGSPKTPEFANVDSTNHAFTSETLKRSRVNLHDCGGFVGMEQTFWDEADRLRRPFLGGLFVCHWQLRFRCGDTRCCHYSHCLGLFKQSLMSSAMGAIYCDDTMDSFRVECIAGVVQYF